MSTIDENADSTGTLTDERLLALVVEFMREVPPAPAVPGDNGDDEAWENHDRERLHYVEKLQSAAMMTIGALRAQGRL